MESCCLLTTGSSSGLRGQRLQLPLIHMMEHAPRKNLVWARLGAWHQVSIALGPVIAGFAWSQVWLLGLQRSSRAAGQLPSGQDMFESCRRGGRSLAAGLRLLRRSVLASGLGGLRVQPSLAAGGQLLLTCLLRSGSCGGSMCIFLWCKVQENLVHYAKAQSLDGCHLCWGKRGEEQLFMVGLQGTRARCGPCSSSIKDMKANSEEA